MEKKIGLVLSEAVEPKELQKQVFKFLEEKSHSQKLLLGTSAGAIVGGFICFWETQNEILDF